ncbi:MAG TPA: radical SAM protein [Verrucomicrobiae bacterium]|nr:radical SAM protein [Verrucomicrobiae bacterium]
MNPGMMRLPWTLDSVPHAILDILRGCNIRCRDCFNTRPDRIKPLPEIKAELEMLLRLRRLQSVTIIGGEVTLHPQLAQIVRMVKMHGLDVELCSNGVDLSDKLLSDLGAAGANAILLHIEPHQQRPDLPAGASVRELRALRVAKAERVVAHGIEAGLSVTVYPDRLAELEETISFTLATPQINYLLVTLWRDIGAVPELTGNLTEGFRAEAVIAPRADKMTNRDVQTFMEQKFGLSPFAYVASNVDATDPRWLSYLVGTVYRDGSPLRQRCLRATPVEKWFLEVSRRVKGRYPFYQRQTAGRFAVQLLLNGLAGGGLTSNLELMARSWRPAATLTSKKLLFQCPATVNGHGQVVHCDCCPDAVVQRGKLVPVCISDRITEAPN